MAPWPFGQRGGLTVAPFSSHNPLVCAHQAARLQILLTEFEGRYEETSMVLNRLEIVYICAGRLEDGDRVHAVKLALVPPANADEGKGIIGRLRWWWEAREMEARFRHGQRAIDRHLADLHRCAPWKSGQDSGAVQGMA
ncbi:hypothetical protein IV500_04980 [Paeniglutamicibacter antarcticus]|uniref:Uncharacterized protein n=1 Tax=Arthrobacter terrae TaxID=2935737 RepID=A0A931CHP2_9MICC|nr:hypothetical protein [Arthrobacter terrae]MBG0738772.1 hypothetical protein [Arthrobacter terrae]